jgi:uncharacterized metal-binding protein YceD (DUF177 family)
MGKFAPYKVNLVAIAEGKFQQDFVIDTQFFKNMENSDVLEADVKVHLDMDYRNGIYDCNFTLRGMLQIPCDRCLDPMEHPIDTTYHIAVKYGPEYDDSSDDVLVIPDSDAFLNVAYMLYDTIVLTIPMRHVHPQGKCNKQMVNALHKHRSAAEDARTLGGDADNFDSEELAQEIDLPDTE